MIDREIINEINKIIEYDFKDPGILELALTHKSYTNEMALKNIYGNERLEFMGDAVLGAVISHIIMERYEDFSEGDLSKMRAAVVNKEALAGILKKLGINRFIILGKGEQENNGREKDSILANVYESIIAAVYFDGGYNSIFNMISSHFEEVLNDAEQDGGYANDYKSRLQEYCQKNINTLPKYIIESEEGPDHIKQFESVVIINNIKYEKGIGRNKKSAEQEAALKTLNRLLKEFK